MSTFLSEEWVQEVTALLSQHQGFNNAMGDADLAIQFSTADAPDGPSRLLPLGWQWNRDGGSRNPGQRRCHRQAVPTTPLLRSPRAR